jgi:hypothetical protein
MIDDDIDTVIAGYLERRDPAEFEAFLDTCGDAMMVYMPDVTAKLRRLHSVLDVNEVIGKSFERALENLTRQFHGEEDGYFFDPKVKKFRGWFLGVVGYPGQGRQSGVAGSEFNRFARERARQEPFEEALLIQSENNPSIDDEHSNLDALERALKKLRPRPAFVLRASYGVHTERLLDPIGIRRLALFVKLDDPTPRQLHRRAQHLFPPHHVPSETLTDSEIGALLDVGDRQVRNIKKAAIAELRRSDS